MARRTIKRVLASLSNSNGAVNFLRFLAQQGAEIVASGGTARMLRENSLEVTDVTQLTGCPEILGGRVKTLHPHIHGGILARYGNPQDDSDLQRLKISRFDLVAVNFYPFQNKVKENATTESIIEAIDIGGPTLLRAAAKNHDSITIATDPEDYDAIMEQIKEHGTTDLPLRRHLAAKAFITSANYEHAIAQWFAENTPAAEKEPHLPPFLNLSSRAKIPLRYGENPHQNAAFYPLEGEKTSPAATTLLQGQPLSWNNVHDADSALALVRDFPTPAACIVKHANPCGVAQNKTPANTFTRALASDPQSAFGGIVALNHSLDAETANALCHLFLEMILAPAISDEARETMRQKPKLRLMINPTLFARRKPSWNLRSVQGGLLAQDEDSNTLSEKNLAALPCPTCRKPTAQETHDLLFAWRIVRHVRSNAVVLAKDGATVGIAGGQTSRVGAVRQAVEAAGDNAKGAVMASDGFFPFPDGVEKAAQAGVRAVIQPGGSMRDKHVIEAADAQRMAMLLTGRRHFRH